MSVNSNYAVLDVWHETRTPNGFRLDVTVPAKVYHKPNWIAYAYEDTRYHNSFEAECGEAAAGDLILLPMSKLRGTSIKPCKECYS